YIGSQSRVNGSPESRRVMKKQPKQHRRRGGFTLVELLVVIGVIALLIGMLMPALTRARGQANRVVCQSNLRQVGVAMLMYADENGGWVFPTGLGWECASVQCVGQTPTF